MQFHIFLMILTSILIRYASCFICKMILICHRFEPRQLGAAGMKMFQTNVLTPGEFKETLKRTFNTLLSPGELGALVSYFDTSMSGVVSTQAFLNAFVQIRVTLEPWKGKSHFNTKSINPGQNRTNLFPFSKR